MGYKYEVLATGMSGDPLIERAIAAHRRASRADVLRAEPAPVSSESFICIGHDGKFVVLRGVAPGSILRVYRVHYGNIRGLKSWPAELDEMAQPRP